MRRMLSKKKILAAITRFPDLFDVLAVVIIGGVIPHNALSVKSPALPEATIKEIVSAGSRHCPAPD